MKRIRYDGEELIALDEVADALTAYVRVLGALGRTDVVRVPTLTISGGSQTVDVFLNPSIHFSTRPIDEPQNDRHPAAAFVAELELRAVGIDTRLDVD